MTRRRLALGLAFCLFASISLWVLCGYVKDWLLVSYVPYYLPCPEFNMKVQFRREKLPQPMAQLQYPQPKLLERRLRTTASDTVCQCQLLDFPALAGDSCYYLHFHMGKLRPSNRATLLPRLLNREASMA